MARKKIKIDKHSLIPKHSKVSEKEKKELLARYSIDLKGLPRILKTDAAIIGLDVNSGDVIKVTRDSPTAGTAIYYRVVVDV